MKIGAEQIIFRIARDVDEEKLSLVREGKSLATALFEEMKSRMGRDFDSVFVNHDQFANMLRAMHGLLKVCSRGPVRDILKRIYRTADTGGEKYEDRRKTSRIYQ